MSITARILKAPPRSQSVRRVPLTDLSEPAESRFQPDDFVPLALPIARTPRAEPHADSHVPSALAALQSAAEQLQTQRDHWLEQSQREAVRLGIAIAERLLRHTLAVQPDAVLELIRSALDWTAHSDRLRVRLHPADAGLVASAKSSLDPHRDIEFLPDDSLARGDCVVETPNGQADARLDLVLQRIADELLME